MCTTDDMRSKELLLEKNVFLQVTIACASPDAKSRACEWKMGLILFDLDFGHEFQDR